MSRRTPDWCTFGLREWHKKPLDERKKTVPCRAVQSVNGLRVCAAHVDDALKEGRAGTGAA